MFQYVSSQSMRCRQPLKPLFAAAFCLASALLVACGSDDSAPASPERNGVFLDASAVEGLGYVTDTKNGKTVQDGGFEFLAGESITFSLGGLALPTVQAADIVTPLTIFGASDASDVRVTNLSRLLQSLDTDGIASNGITLPLEIESITSDTVLEFDSANFDAQAEALVTDLNQSQTTLVDENTANAELNQSLVENNVVAGDCTSDHPFVNREAELSDLSFHGVSGTIKVLNDCVIEVTNFNYDGGGPAVYFFAATDRSFFSTDAFDIGPMLSGQRWVNDTLLLNIPEGMTLDDFNSLSVWCERFGINFGDAFFGDL